MDLFNNLTSFLANDFFFSHYQSTALLSTYYACTLRVAVVSLETVQGAAALFRSLS